jgi:hypothetical protein
MREQRRPSAASITAPVMTRSIGTQASCSIQTGHPATLWSMLLRQTGPIEHVMRLFRRLLFGSAANNWIICLLPPETATSAHASPPQVSGLDDVPIGQMVHKTYARPMVQARLIVALILLRKREGLRRLGTAHWRLEIDLLHARPEGAHIETFNRAQRYNIMKLMLIGGC